MAILVAAILIAHRALVIAKVRISILTTRITVFDLKALASVQSGRQNTLGELEGPVAAVANIAKRLLPARLASYSAASA